jgi:hypothetical protein
MTTPAEVSTFEGAVAALAKNPDETLLESLHETFDDSCRHPEVMWGLVHFLESFPVRGQLEALAKSVRVMRAQAPEWMSILHKGVLNDPGATSCYVDVLRTADQETRRAVVDVLRELGKSRQFAVQVSEILRALGETG